MSFWVEFKGVPTLGSVGEASKKKITFFGTSFYIVFSIVNRVAEPGGFYPEPNLVPALEKSPDHRQLHDRIHLLLFFDIKVKMIDVSIIT